MSAQRQFRAEFKVHRKQSVCGKGCLACWQNKNHHAHALGVDKRTVPHIQVQEDALAAMTKAERLFESNAQLGAELSAQEAQKAKQQDVATKPKAVVVVTTPLRAYRRKSKNPKTKKSTRQFQRRRACLLAEEEAGID